jgi:hypothetical protein
MKAAFIEDEDELTWPSYNYKKGITTITMETRTEVIGSTTSLCLSMVKHKELVTVTDDS